jgi:hypothetical protein
MDDEMLRRVVAKVHEVCETVGFGSVTIVIEKGRPRWIEAGTREWLEQREGAPPGRVKSEMQM